MNPKMLFWLAPLALVGCGAELTSSRGFRLPDGDAEAGQIVFAQFECVVCHSVEGAEFPAAAEEPDFDVRLGGKVNRVSSYGELVTAVINPSHDISDAYPQGMVSQDGHSLMGDVNNEMTVQQLIDLVAFLQSTYMEYLPDDYDPYFP